jgi:hypothetical protein
VTPAPPLVHASFFRKPADQTLKFFLSAPGAAMSAADLQTYNQKLATFLDTSSKGAMFVEVDVKEAGGQDLSINDLLSQQGAQVIDAQTLSTNFSADATFFVYRDKNGVWPGYVLSLAQGKDWSIVQASLKNVEASINTSNISAMFLADVGTPSVSGFKDSTIASATAVRTLAFTGGSVPGAFLYGWTLDHRYLILSTSPSGFSAALKRL